VSRRFDPSRQLGEPWVNLLLVVLLVAVAYCYLSSLSDRQDIGRGFIAFQEALGRLLYAHGSTQYSRAMQDLQAVFVTSVVVVITSMLVASAMAGYSNFVFAAQADSPGNDYKRVAGLSFDQCVTACDADTDCNAFTYNELKGICFLKSAAAQWTILRVGAITGIKLSPLSLGETKQDRSPVPDDEQRSGPAGR